MIFLDTAEGVATNLRPFWSEATGGRANVVQAVPDMLEIVPPGTSKGRGVKLLLDHLGITANEVWEDIIYSVLLFFILSSFLFRIKKLSIRLAVVAVGVSFLLIVIVSFSLMSLSHSLGENDALTTL